MKNISILIVSLLLLFISYGSVFSDEKPENENSKVVEENVKSDDTEKNKEGETETLHEEELTQEEWEKREKTEAAKALFQKRCSKCHPYQRPLSKKKTLAEWKATVERMRDKNPAWVLPAEVDRIYEYLSEIRGKEGMGEEAKEERKEKKSK